MLVGQEKEVTFLKEIADRDEAQLIAVYGRREIGKSYLIHSVFDGRFTFQHAGVYKGTRAEQLTAFFNSLLNAGLVGNSRVPKNWFEAFQLLKRLIGQSTHKKKILFIDELSFMDTPKTDLMRALEHFWNAWASARNDIVMIVCSSATSWIIKKIIHNKGGLYNRLTGRIWLKPFTLAQCKVYVNQMELGFSDTQIAELYMAVGGIPFYWGLMKRGLSVSQNMDELFFSEDAPLRQKYEYLFASIFRNPGDYLKIIQALAGKKIGLTRNEILEKTGLTGSGVFSEKLTELETCGFIRECHAFGKKSKDSLYQLMDPFVLFYHHFLKSKPKDPAFWSHQINTPAVNSWEGWAFEQVCLLHADQIRKRLGISGILTDVSSFTCQANPEAGIIGSQIDMVIWQADRTVNLLEMKFARNACLITKTVNQELRNKASDFFRVTGTKDAIHLTLVTPYGVVRNEYAGEIQSEITLADLMQD